MIREAQLVEERENAQGLNLPALLVEIERGTITESRHYGHIAVLNGDGHVLASLGVPDTVTFLRSSAKPFQTIPLVASGAAEHFGFTDREIAIACGSHNGEAEHVDAVTSMLGKIGFDETALHCGAHEPYGKEAAEELKRLGLKPSPLHNNCSGKHAAMLALARYLKAPVENYEEPEHPVQRMIAKVVAQFAGVSESEMGLGVDGCGALNFAVPVSAMALMFARLVRPPADFEDATRAACAALIKAMQAHPEMVEGRGELDTELMKARRGKLVSKVGAEGVYTAGVLPCDKFPEGLGLAFKIEDGDKGDRARSPLAVEILGRLGLIEDAYMERLTQWVNPVIRNHRGERVGCVRPAFELEQSS